MTALCTAADCGRPSPDAYLCGEHTHRLETLLAEIPGYLADLDVTRSRLDKIAPTGNRSRRGKRANAVEACWCGCTTTDPFHHFAHHQHYYSERTAVSDRRYARPEDGSTSTSFSIAAGAAATEAETVLTTWSRHLVESRGLTADLGERDLLEGPHHGGCHHSSCVTIREQAVRPDLLPRLALWLLARVPSIRLDEGAGELLWDVTAMHRQVRRVVDRPADRVYAGPCSCGLDLYAPTAFLAGEGKTGDDPLIVCDGWNSDTGEGCGIPHLRSERRSFLLEALDTHSGPLTELLPLLCQLLPAPQPPRQVVWNWRNRGQVKVVTVDHNGVEHLSAADLASMLRRYEPVPQRAPKSGRMAS